VRAWRSLLFVPGARPERFEKALSAGADAICIDLEDAVPPEQKQQARIKAIEFISRERDGGPAVGLRLNGLRTREGIGDLAILSASEARPDFIMVPKAAHAEELAIVAAVLGPAARLFPIVESAEGLKNVWDICAAAQVEAVLFGGADFSADLGAALSWEAMLHVRSVLAAACARAGVALFDVPHLDVEDDAGLTESTLRAKALGFTARACIHPRQVAGVNAAFTPTPEEIDRARRVIAALEDAQGAAALLDGKLVELPVIRAAERVLARAPGGVHSA
jgi:(S)-citramalyl-CoA lyase